MSGLHRLYSGDFNTMQVEQQPDGSQVIKLTKDGEDKVHRFRVKDLYGPNEEIMEDETIKVETPKHVKQRVEEARRNAGSETYTYTAPDAGGLPPAMP